MYLGLTEINHWLPVILEGIFLIISTLAGASIASIFLSVVGFAKLSFLYKYTYLFINLLFPFTIFLGKFIGIRRRQIEKSYIAVSNQIIRNKQIKVSPDKLLVITPHCLQLASCPHKITRDPNGNCKRCGACDIGRLVNLSNEIGFHFFVVTGGTLARQTIKKIRPKAVLAIACERDLASGIQDVFPLPVIGILNIRPNGPCYNTHVDVDLVRSEIKKLIDSSSVKE